MIRLLMVVLVAGACGKDSAVGSGSAAPASVSGAQHTQQAVVELVKGCDSGRSDNCVVAGMAYVKGDGVASDPEHGRALFQRGCEGGARLACAHLAHLYRTGDGIPFDMGKAFAYALNACDAFTNTDPANGVVLGLACMSAAKAARTGRGTKPDIARVAELEAIGIKFYQAACTAAPVHCRNLALAYEQAEGVAGDQAKARELYTKACDADEFGSCSNLGALWKQGLGGAKDVAKAAALFRRACDGGVTTACPYAK